MIEEPLVFHCVCGQPGAVPDAERQPWAQIVGYATHSAVRWHLSAEAAQVDQEPIDVLDVPPEPGQSYWLRLGMPFAHQAREMFWCLYEGPSLYFNGFEDDVEALNSIRLVTCRLDSWERYGDRCVIGRVSVRETVSLAQLSTRPAFAVTDPDLLQEFAWGDRDRHRMGQYLILENSHQGDDGNWLIAEMKDAPELLVMGNWGSHGDYVWAGRGRLSPELVERFSALMDAV